MIDIIKDLQQKITETTITNKETLESFRRDFIGKKGDITRLFEVFKSYTTVEKKSIGPLLNNLKQIAEAKLKKATQQLEIESKPATLASLDVTLPAIGPPIGSLHPLRIIQSKIIRLFKQLGFNLVEGTEIVEDWHNFTALNFPEEHPAREMQDTFFIQRNPDRLLRTHTTAVQISTCCTQPPPIRSITAGRVFRNESISSRSHCFFHQIDGMYIDHLVTFNDLHRTIAHFIRRLFGHTTQLRFRASYFPFTEPSAEVDISCKICQGTGCNLCKQTGWVEILGGGMIDPQVLINCKIDPEIYSGFAFGMGIERIAMLFYQIDDLRLFSENHVDFLRQFKAAG